MTWLESWWRDRRAERPVAPFPLDLDGPVEGLLWYLHRSAQLETATKFHWTGLVVDEGALRSRLEELRLSQPDPGNSSKGTK